MWTGIVTNYYAYRGEVEVYQKKKNLEHLTFYPKFFKSCIKNVCFKNKSKAEKHVVIKENSLCNTLACSKQQLEKIK